MWIRNFFLCKKYPFLRIKNVWNGKKYSYKYTELDLMPIGWKKKFGLQICKELKNAFKKSNVKHFEREYCITQIKEKYGSLRWYDTGFPLDITEECNKIIEKYEDLSRKICVICGKEVSLYKPADVSIHENCRKKLSKTSIKSI